MKQPRYEIGEMVVVQSKHYPEDNGEAVICDRAFNDRVKMWAYKIHGQESKVWLRETSIKKYYRPAHNSFNELMAWAKAGIFVKQPTNPKGKSQ